MLYYFFVTTFFFLFPTSSIYIFLTCIALHTFTYRQKDRTYLFTYTPTCSTSLSHTRSDLSPSSGNLLFWPPLPSSLSLSLSTRRSSQLLGDEAKTYSFSYSLHQRPSARTYPHQPLLPPTPPPLQSSGFSTTCFFFFLSYRVSSATFCTIFFFAFYLLITIINSRKI
ncbi:hypothetical protein BDB00DRAFT_624324 [Zychaea mexicana]|uniref:uncharacterized protein n=1 Tax=Zychaea mexicana TaxID=64656 RepID=UPI0022FE5F22|nr:uncharacterized protein BDB00DRAFT_624324 [Zychaea mexicana]KAI9497455.1 hypothetical protein BDB00DRAFT_624324 [Zychaea mexicana]